MNTAEEFVYFIKEDILREMGYLEKDKRTPDKVAERVAKRICGLLIASKLEAFGDFFLLSEADSNGMCDYELASQMKGLYPSKKEILARVKEKVRKAKKEILNGLSPQDRETLGIE